jgi:hypothetical protein
MSLPRVYISHDVVFDENVFPFAALHPNAGTRLKQAILLLPSSTTPPQEDDANFDDHIVPIVSSTNVLQDGEVTEEKRTENRYETSSETSENRASLHVEEDGEPSMEHEEEYSSAPPDPEEDPEAPDPEEDLCTNPEEDLRANSCADLAPGHSPIDACHEPSGLALSPDVMSPLSRGTDLPRWPHLQTRLQIVQAAPLLRLMIRCHLRQYNLRHHQ